MILSSFVFVAIFLVLPSEGFILFLFFSPLFLHFKLTLMGSAVKDANWFDVKTEQKLEHFDGEVHVSQCLVLLALVGVSA